MHPKLIELITRDAIALFRLEEDKLYGMKMHYGCLFLEHLYESDPRIERALKAHPNFWKWWIELWAIRDRKLILASGMRRYGIDYTFPVNRLRQPDNSYATVPSAIPLMRTKQIFLEELEDFYQDWHYWSNVKFYPNEEMVSECLSTAPEPQIINVKL